MFMADHSKPDLYVLTLILSFRFIPRRYLRELLPVPERNETLVVLVPCAPPCEIRGPAASHALWNLWS